MSGEFKLKRKTLFDHATIGILYQDEEHICWTLEDKVREIEGKPVTDWKIKGATAIPRGRYQVIVTPSPRFKTELPLLVGVPGFEGVRIHAGNTHEDTEGCILVGRRPVADTVIESRFALLDVIARIKYALFEGPVFLEIS